MMRSSGRHDERICQWQISTSHRVLGDSPLGRSTLGRADPKDVTVSQAAELSRMKARINALTEKTIANGCTEAKAMAAEMVGRLWPRPGGKMRQLPCVCS